MRNKLYRVAAWYWFSKSRQRRMTWVFNTVEKAIRWRKNKYWKFAEFQNIEQYLSTIPESRWDVERRRWIEHRDRFLDLELHRAYVLLPNRGIHNSYDKGEEDDGD